MAGDAIIKRFYSDKCGMVLDQVIGVI